MSDLKPCPFCGAEATLDYNTMRDHLGFPSTIQHRCAKCGAAGPFTKYNLPPAPNPEADDAWNRRTHDRAALVEVARRTSIYVDHFDHEYDGQEQEIAQVAEARAEFIVAEYMDEQAGKETQ